MNTVKELMVKTGLSAEAIRWRCRKLKIEKRYRPGYNDSPERIFTPEEADRIINYQPGKSGRRWYKDANAE